MCGDQSGPVHRYPEKRENSILNAEAPSICKMVCADLNGSFARCSSKLHGTQMYAKQVQRRHIYPKHAIQHKHSCSWAPLVCSARGPTHLCARRMCEAVRSEVVSGGLKKMRSEVVACVSAHMGHKTLDIGACIIHYVVCYWRQPNTFYITPTNVG